MSDNSAGHTAPATQSTSKKRGRPVGTPSVKVEKKADHPQHRIEQLKAELEKAQDALREFEARRACIVGKVVVTHALTNPDYGKQLAALLRKEITGKGDLALIEQLLS